MRSGEYRSRKSESNQIQKVAFTYKMPRKSHRSNSDIGISRDSPPQTCPICPQASTRAQCLAPEAIEMGQVLWVFTLNHPRSSKVISGHPRSSGGQVGHRLRLQPLSCRCSMIRLRSARSARSAPLALFRRSHSPAQCPGGPLATGEPICPSDKEGHGL